MCIIAFAVNTHPEYPLILIGNRDEFYLRKTAELGFWQDAPDILGGRDLKAAGSWLAVSKQNGRLAAVTNIRRPDIKTENALSRGLLVRDYLHSDDPQAFYEDIKNKMYSPFNLLCYDHGKMHYFSNIYPNQVLNQGVYVVSNGELNNNWPKTELLKTLFTQEIKNPNKAYLLQLLKNTQKPKQQDLPDTGVGTAFEKLLSSIFISSAAYGTRSSHVILLDKQNTLYFAEQRFGAFGKTLGFTEHQIQLGYT